MSRGYGEETVGESFDRNLGTDLSHLIRLYLIRLVRRKMKLFLALNSTTHLIRPLREPQAKFSRKQLWFVNVPLKIIVFPGRKIMTFLALNSTTYLIRLISGKTTNFT